MRYLLLTFLFLLSGLYLDAQTCTTLGQTPATAFPVCGTSTFHQANVPICNTRNLTVPGCGNDGAAYADKNPFWYKFTCFQSGTLGFLINPKDQGDDYDWQLYDITGRDPNAVFTDRSLVVTGNWAGTYGNTGASASGVSFIQCASDPNDRKNSFAKMPQILAGHTYLLLVSHFTNTQSGYDLSFGGGTAVITDTKLPLLQSVEASCNGNVIRLKLNKRVKCTSITSGGTEFVLNQANIAVAGATGIGCSSGFDTDSIELRLSSPLQPGTYSLSIRSGSDNNTLLDHCDNSVPVSSKVDFTVEPLLPTPMDSLATVQCQPQTLRLVFRKPILCSSVAADGSDFMVSGSYPVSVSGATANCSANASSSKEIIVQLSQPLLQAGNFTISLKKGVDGNTILDECSKETPEGSSLQFSVKDTVNAGFTYDKKYGCTIDTVHFFHAGGNDVNSWKWNLDEGQASTRQNPTGLYRQFTQKNVKLIVSNGFCSDTATQVVSLTNYLKAGFSVFEDNCPNEEVSFNSQALGLIRQHAWSFGDGGSSTEPSPAHIYRQPDRTTSFTVRYTVTDSLGCQSSAQKSIIVYSNCYLAVPNAFTPNSDGRNDFLRPVNAVKTRQLTFKVYNRWGQLVFQTADWKRGWDGTINGLPQTAGMYAWVLQYIDRDTGESRLMKGTAALIR